MSSESRAAESPEHESPRPDGLAVLIVDDHAVFADTLADALLGTDVVGSAVACHSAADARRLSEERSIDVAVVDLRMPDVDEVELVGELAGSTSVVVLTVMEDARTIVSALEAGARGFVTKTEGFDAIVAAIRAVSHGGVPISPSVMSRLLPRLVSTGDDVRLTRREESVLELIGDGCSNAEIAERLDVSTNTVRNHLYNIMRKLDVSSRAAAVVEARSRRLLPPD